MSRQPTKTPQIRKIARNHMHLEILLFLPIVEKLPRKEFVNSFTTGKFSMLAKHLLPLLSF